MSVQRKRRARPTPGRIARAVTQEVSIVTDPANAEEFIVKNNDGNLAGEVSSGLIKKMAGLGFSFSNELEATEKSAVAIEPETVIVEGEATEKSDSIDEGGDEGQSIADEIAKGIANLVDLESKVMQMEETETALDDLEKGRKVKKSSRKGLLAALKEMATKIADLIADAGVEPAKQEPAAKAVEAPVAPVAEAVEAVEAVEATVVETPPEAAVAVEATVVEPAAKKEEIEDEKSDLPDMVIPNHSTASSDVIARLGEFIEAGFQKLADQDAEQFASLAEKQEKKIVEMPLAATPVVDEPGSDMQKQLDEVSNEIAMEKIRIKDEAVKAQTDVVLSAMQKQLDDQRAELEGLKKVRIGSAALDITPDEAPEETVTKAEPNIFAGEGVLGSFGDSFRNTYKNGKQ